MQSSLREASARTARLIRHRCLQRLDFLGATLDEDLNRDALVDEADRCVELVAPGSRVRLLALRADEELAMAEAIAPLLDAQYLREPSTHAFRLRSRRVTRICPAHARGLCSDRGFS
jgi:polysaccharide pyruvyl transferase WcaK-like protein